MSKRESLEGILSRIYGLDDDPDSNSQRIISPRCRKQKDYDFEGLSDFYRPLDDSLDRLSKDNKIIYFPDFLKNHIKIFPQEKDFIKEKYEKLDYIIKEDYNRINSKIREETNSLIISLEEILEKYTSIGFRLKKQNISPEYNTRIPEFEAPETEKIPQPVKVTRQGLAPEFRPLFALLEKQYHGQRMQLHVVAKDHDEREEKIPAFLNSLGIQTHSIYDTNTRLLIEHVGYHDLKETAKTGSESELRKACEKALDKISQIHVLASLHLAELESTGLSLETTDYVSRFKSRFLEPVSGHSVIISPQMDKLMQAYSAFTRTFDPQYFIHGDFHTGNCRMTDEECFVIDYEAARIGMKFDDLSRFVNSVLRDRPDIDAAEFSREMLGIYVDSHNQHSEENRTPLMLNNERLANALRYSLIDEQIVKIGEKVAFAEAHPKAAEKKLEESAECFDGAVRMLDGAIETADNNRSYYEWETLSKLRASLVDYAADSPVEQLKQAAQRYKTPGYKKESLILVPAA